MICPNCSREVPNGSFECPYCGEPLYATQRINLNELTWCRVCGALVRSGDTACPKCGSPIPGAAQAKKQEEHKEPEVDAEAGEQPGFESAIPPTGPDAVTASSVNDLLPRMKQFVVAAGAAILIVGGTALAITHPWNPTVNDTRATTPYDTSNAGSPGSLDSLSAQDRSQDDGSSGDESDDPAFDNLSRDYGELKELADAVDDCESKLSTTGLTGSADERSQAYVDARNVSIRVSNLISDLEQCSDGDGLYADDISNLKSLGNWLRNRCDAITACWKASAEAQDPQAEKDQILPGSQSSSYKSLFDQNYDSWAPQKAER